MSSDPVWSAVAGAIVIFLVKAGWIQPTWEAIKAGLLWVTKLPVRSRKEKLTSLQIEFKTTMKWHDIRWDIARLEHELMPKDKWTHDVKDCVDPTCNPEYIEHLTELWIGVKAGSIKKPAVIPVLKKPPPPPPKFSRGGPVKASEADSPGMMRGYRTEYMCLLCGSVSEGASCTRCAAQDDIPF